MRQYCSMHMRTFTFPVDSSCGTFRLNFIPFLAIHSTHWISNLSQRSLKVQRPRTRQAA